MVHVRPIVYSDFNCPFCFVLNEWLMRLGHEDRIEWTGVEHDSGLIAGREATDQEQEELAREVATVSQRAPDLVINRPPFRPSSRASLAAMVYVRGSAPESAHVFRTRTFRALWHEGRDISSAAVLGQLLGEVGLGHPDSLEEYCRQVDQTTEQWRKAEYNRIPVVVSPAETTRLGLGDLESLEVFLGSALFDSAKPGVCIAKEAK